MAQECSRGRLSVPVVASLALLVLTGAACGGGSSVAGAASASPSSSSTAASSSTATPAPASASAATASSSTATSTDRSSTAAPIRARIVGRNHHPVVGTPWPLTVTARSADGRPLSGRVEIEFTFGGELVGRDTPPVHPFSRGRWHEKLTFPTEAADRQLDVEAVVHTSQGVVTLDWPIVVHH